MTLDVRDANGALRPPDEVEKALRWVEQSIVKNPLAMDDAGMPVLLHFVVIRDVLRAALKENPPTKR